MEETISSNLEFSKLSSVNLISPDRNVPRRKSSIFNRRNTFVGDNENVQCCGSSSEIVDRSASELDFNIDTYITCLKKEVADWENMYKERKKARTLAKKRYRLNNVLREEDVFVMFNEDDKKFLQGRQDYSGVVRKAVVEMEKLSISLQKKLDIEKSSHKVINYVQKTETELRKKIVECSDLE